LNLIFTFLGICMNEGRSVWHLVQSTIVAKIFQFHKK
jgi:hypothetical protein